MGSLPNFLKQRRLKLGMTLKQVGGLAGLSPAVVWQYESGYRTPKLGNLRKLAKVLKFKVEAP